MIKKKNNKKIDKKAQEIFGLSFGMIFSIILIIFFIVVAFIVIKHFLSIQNCSKIGIFINDIEEEVERAWNSNDQSVEFKGYLPSGIKKVCFANVSESFRGADKEIGTYIDIYIDKNMFLYPLNKACDMAKYSLPHIDVNWITRTNNPYCIDVIKGKVLMIIEKNSNDRLVKIIKK
ncbi:MAG: hypothetical protein QXW97_04000 [Candidatus Pacearchaeota archaeon]